MKQRENTTYDLRVRRNDKMENNADALRCPLKKILSVPENQPQEMKQEHRSVLWFL